MFGRKNKIVVVHESGKAMRNRTATLVFLSLIAVVGAVILCGIMFHVF